jgi:hypothetical protein
LNQDAELAAIIANLATEARLEVQSDIPRFLAARGICRLFHFTSINNLESIATHGLLGRDSLETKGIEFITSDQTRYDPILDGICFSISRPNYYMAAQKIKSGHQFVLLELQNLGELLANYNFIACPGNFGTLYLKRKLQSWPEEFIGGNGLVNLFRNEKIREKYAIPIFEPTDPQSEIVILESIPWNFVKKVYFPNLTEYSVREEVEKIVRKLPKGLVFQSQIGQVFPEIDWSNERVIEEFVDRKFSETWV